ncbi:hypothetical protein D3C81_350310 [compost metagenome]
MRLNLFNQSVIVGSALQDCALNPRFGQVTPAGSKGFKFTPLGDTRNAFMVERVDLGELFKNIPQDITGVVYKAHKAVDAPLLLMKLNFDDTAREPLLDSEDPVFSEADELTRYFEIWCEVVGIRDLPRYAVELGLAEGNLIVDASKATLYKGQVTVKVL